MRIRLEECLAPLSLRSERNSIRGGMDMNRWIKHNAVRLALVSGLFLVGGTVLAQDVKTNYVPGTDFSKYHSYKWGEYLEVSIPTRSWMPRSRTPSTWSLRRRG